MMLIRILIAIIEVPAVLLEALAGTIRGAFAILRVWLHRPYDYKRWLLRDLANCETILELGCGRNSPILQIGLGSRTYAVDIWQPYVDLHNRNGDYRQCMKQDLLTIDYPDKPLYDAVVITDVMEHLLREKVEHMDLFACMERTARKRVIIFTPNGFIENDLVDDDDDPWQEHVSAWEPEDYLKRGYTVKGATGIRWVLGKASLPRLRPYSLWAILAMISQPYIYNHPNWARHSYAVKDIK